ncbi:hypothetical protein Poli38472_014564 [Pythium oligandrum]|uniref:VWFA domain-containing protein n=1 Tax=Pythium oligandrum TaxID=41045 RepID=A0A8K1CPE2_PYTOL|nr:hypothetical protein Poli38472_014564 [Pythium oligandrum]|eukprot:TMW66588.1 hypothetical protein Poli38472_014564 [Pythium oligandrum]
MGRQHVHYLDCEQEEPGKCIYNGGPEDMRRHCTRALEPKPDHEMDEVLHERFWDTLGWEDPCASLQERDEFAKCGYKCDAPDHDDSAVSYCVLPAWHQPEVKPTTGSDGFSYVSGHKFECTHTATGDKIHHVFVLDCSGSMHGWPWDKLLAAFREYVHNRIDEGACQDLVSVITFDSSATIEYESASIQSMTTANVRFRGGGTSFSAGLRAANEVLSRVRFEAYKPVLMFFSDGHPDDPHEGKQMATHIQQSYDKYGLEAFAVGFGVVNLSLLYRVARRLGGSYHHALTGAELKSTFYKISVSLGATTGLALIKPIHETLCVICQKELAAEATIVLMPCHHELHQCCFRLLTEQTDEGDVVLCPTCRQEVIL